MMEAVPHGPIGLRIEPHTRVSWGNPSIIGTTVRKGQFGKWLVVRDGGMGSCWVPEEDLGRIPTPEP